MSDELDGLEVVAFRRLITRLCDASEEEVDEMNPVEKVNSALDRVERLETENERLKERVAELEASVDPDPTSKPYEEMTGAERTRKVRETLVEEAQRRHSGKAQMTYKEVLRLFNNHPSDGYAYKLMKRAAEEEGFEYVEDRPKRIRVKSGAVKDETLFHGVNKTATAEAD